MPLANDICCCTAQCGRSFTSRICGFILEQARMTRWTSLIDDMVEGRWTNPETGKPGAVPYKMVVIEERLDGADADLVSKLGFRGSIADVTVESTLDGRGARVAAVLWRCM